MKAVVIGGSGHFHLLRQAMDAGYPVELLALAPGRPEEDLSAVEEAFPGVRQVRDWRETLSTGAELAVVNPWFCDAGEIAAVCLEAGLHVYCEKPLSTTWAGLERLERAWKNSGKALGGMFNYRHAPWFLAMEQAVLQGEIGEIRQIHAQKSYRMGERPDFYRNRDTFGGLIPWVAVHAIDWACAFGGDCRWVCASHSRRENRGHGEMEVSSGILMGMEQERIATVTADYFRPDASARHDDDRLRLTGTQGMLEARDGRVYLENHRQRRELSLPRGESAFQKFWEAACSGQAREMGRRALYATRVALAARDSADADGVRQWVEREK